MSARLPKLKYSADVLSRTWQAGSMLMDYPGDDLRARLDLLEQTAQSLPEKLGGGLGQTIEHLRQAPIRECQSDYVETFDTRRRGCFFLAYFSHGDTRNRGLALLRIKQDDMKAVRHMTDDQLPYHLSDVLEFSATSVQQSGLKNMLDNLVGMEL